MFFAMGRQILISRHAQIRSKERGVDLALGRPLRSFFALSGWFAFWPFEGGSDELLGVLLKPVSIRLLPLSKTRWG
jgi:hypothetical protein